MTSRTKFSLFLLIVFIIPIESAFGIPFDIVSDTSVQAFGPLTDITNGASPVPPDVNDAEWGVGGNSVLVAEPNVAWATIDDAQWISTDEYREDPNAYTYRKFEVNFYIPDDAVDFSGKLYITSDNTVSSYLNGSYIGRWAEYASIGEYDISNYLHNGSNLFQFRVANTWRPGTLYDDTNMLTNPTGLIFKASIDVAPVPEPATMLLFGTGLVGLAGSRFRRKKM